MKPIVRAFPVLILLLVLFPVSLYAISIFDVIRLTQEKYSDQEIIKVIRVTDSRFVLTADDTARLKKEGVTENVIREMLSRPAKEKAASSPVQSSAKPARPASTATRDSGKEAPPEAHTQPHDSAAVLNEIVRMTKAGLADETVLAFAKAHRADLPSAMPADRLAWLRESGVSQSVILYLTAIDVRASNDGAVESATYASDDGETVPVPAYSNPAPVYESGYDDGGTYAVFRALLPRRATTPPTTATTRITAATTTPTTAATIPTTPPGSSSMRAFSSDRHHGHGHGHDGPRTWARARRSGGGHHGDGHGGSPGDRPRGNGGNLAARSGLAPASPPGERQLLPGLPPAERAQSPAAATSDAPRCRRAAWTGLSRLRQPRRGGRPRLLGRPRLFRLHGRSRPDHPPRLLRQPRLLRRHGRPRPDHPLRRGSAAFSRPRLLGRRRSPRRRRLGRPRPDRPLRRRRGRAGGGGMGHAGGGGGEDKEDPARPDCPLGPTP